MRSSFFIGFTSACISTFRAPFRGSIWRFYSRVFPFWHRRVSMSVPQLLSMTMTSSAPTTSADAVNHDAEKKLFFINLVGEPEKAVVEYEVISPNKVNLYHTGVPPSQRGKGIGKILAKAALDHFVSQGTDMKLSCTYLQKYVKDNPLPAYKDRIQEL